MRKIFTAIVLILSLNVFADIQLSDIQAPQPTAAEQASNRACFSELERQGCGDPGDDVEHFRSCMKNVLPSLDANCKALMKDLYQAK